MATKTTRPSVKKASVPRATGGRYNPKPAGRARAAVASGSNKNNARTQFNKGRGA